MMVSGLTIATTSRTDGNHKSKTIRIVEVRSLRRSPAKHIELLPQDQVFRFQRCSRLEARRQDTEYQLEQIDHQDAYAVRLLRLRRIEFSVHTGSAEPYPKEMPP